MKHVACLRITELLLLFFCLHIMMNTHERERALRRVRVIALLTLQRELDSIIVDFSSICLFRCCCPRGEEESHESANCDLSSRLRSWREENWVQFQNVMIVRVRDCWAAKSTGWHPLEVVRSTSCCSRRPEKVGNRMRINLSINRWNMKNWHFTLFSSSAAVFVAFSIMLWVDQYFTGKIIFTARHVILFRARVQWLKPENGESGARCH